MSLRRAPRSVGRRAWFSLPSRQLFVVGILGVLLSVAVVVTNVVSLNHVDARLERVNVSLRPAGAALESTSRYLAAEQSAVHAMKPVAILPSAAITSLLKMSTQTEASWAAFRSHAVGLPGEARDRVSFRTAYRTYRRSLVDAAGVQLGQNPDAEALVRFDRAYLDSQSALSRLSNLYGRAADAKSAQAASGVRSTRMLVLVGSLIGLAIFAGAFLIVFLGLRRREARLATDEARHELERERARLEGELQQAFDMVSTEDGAYEVIGAALTKTASGHHAELLVADSSRAHFRQVVTNTDPPHSGCGVGDPRECPATSRTRTLVFDTSTRIAACPYLRGRPEGPCSAVCVPVIIAGKSIGVLHVTGADGDPSDANLVETLALIGRKSGDRLGTLRAFAKTEAQAHTDPLTGLLNRRSLENQVEDLIEDGRSYVVAYGDIDHFKRLNDLHGHDTGDRALRLFSRVLRDSVRPSDLPARYGGEEFVVVLPDCGVDGAVAVVERVREQLALQLADGQLPGFTISFGVAASSVGALFSETVETADQALLQAKSDGRNRVVTAPTPGEQVRSEAPVTASH